MARNQPLNWESEGIKPRFDNHIKGITVKEWTPPYP